MERSAVEGAWALGQVLLSINLMFVEQSGATLKIADYEYKIRDATVVKHGGILAME